MKKKIKQKILPAVFFFCWFAIPLIAGNMEHGYITMTEAIVYVTVDVVVLGISGFMSGMLTLPDEGRRK